MKIWAFVAEIFSKQYWCFLILDFQCIFDISAIMQLQSLQRWIITECLWNFFETRSQNGPISVQWKHQSEFIFCILRLSHKHITFDTLRWTPCTSQYFLKNSRYLWRFSEGDKLSQTRCLLTSTMSSAAAWQVRMDKSRSGILKKGHNLGVNLGLVNLGLRKPRKMEF